MIVRLPSRSIVSLLVNVPYVVIAKLLKLVKPVKESLSWVKSSVRIKFKLADEMVPALEISLAKFGASIVTVSASIVDVATVLKLFPTVAVKLVVVIVDIGLRLSKSFDAVAVKLVVVIVRSLTKSFAVTVRLPALIMDEFVKVFIAVTVRISTLIMYACVKLLTTLIVKLSRSK